MSSDVIHRPTITRWVLVLGISWFLAGFVGPMIVAPGANQGPMIGIFISGPAGVVCGLVFAWIARMLHLSAQKAGRALIGLAVVGSLVIVIVCIPSPRLSARLIEGSIVSCNPPSTLRTRTAVSMQDFSDKHFAALRKSNPWTLQAWENRFDELAVKEGGRDTRRPDFQSRRPVSWRGALG